MSQATIAVIMGGASFERQISIESGRIIVNALKKAGYTAIPLDADENLVPALEESKPDACYLALHGKGGEDGSVAALLEFLGIPYVGSPPEAARLAHYKPSVSFVLADVAGKFSCPEQLTLPESAFRTMGAAFALSKVAKRLGGFPLAVKPARGGSALGLSKVTREDQLGDAVMEALAYDDEVLFQKWIDGVEVSCLVIPKLDRVFTPVEVSTKEGHLYDTQARLEEHIVTFKTPDPQKIDCALVRDVALDVAKYYDTSGIVRVDMLYAHNSVYVLDLKVSPGFGEKSIAHFAITQDGATVEDVVASVLPCKE